MRSRPLSTRAAHGPGAQDGRVVNIPIRIPDITGRIDDYGGADLLQIWRKLPAPGRRPPTSRGRALPQRLVARVGGSHNGNGLRSARRDGLAELEHGDAVG